MSVSCAAMSISFKRKVDAKLVITGNSCVGKTSLMERFVYNRFSNLDVGARTLGATFVSKEVTRGKKSINIAIWDTAGAERHRAMMPNFYRGAKAAIVCFDLTDGVSWRVLKTWVSELKEREPNCKIFICATKKDLVDEGLAPRDVPETTIDFYTKSRQIPYIETSSKTGENVETLFSMIVDDLWDDVISSQANLDSSRIALEPTPKTRCCHHS